MKPRRPKRDRFLYGFVACLFWPWQRLFNLWTALTPRYGDQWAPKSAPAASPLVVGDASLTSPLIAPSRFQAEERGSYVEAKYLRDIAHR